MNNHAPHQSPNLPQPPIRDAVHYLHLLKRSKWYILISCPTVLLVALAFVFLVVRPENPELTARALIGLERTSDVSGGKQGVAANQGRENIMMSRSFLKGVVQKLSLQLRTDAHARDELFDSVSADSTAACGTYHVRFNPRKSDEYVVWYYDTTQISLPLLGFLPGSSHRVIASGVWASDAPVHLPGASLKLSTSIRTRPREFSFRVVDIRVAVEAIYRNLTIKKADPDRGINYISVVLASREYSLAAATVNAIAAAFIEKNFGFRRQRARNAVESFSTQLQIAHDNLATAESKIRDFRSDNPQVDLSRQTQQAVTGLVKIDKSVQQTSSDMMNATRIRNKYLDADSAQRMLLAAEMAELLWAHAIPAGKTLSEELNRLLAQRHTMTNAFGAKHPLVQENYRDIEHVSGAISAALNDFINGTQSVLTKQQQTSQQLSSRLRQIPALEMELGELSRNQKVYAEMYAAVLAAYNKARVADAIEMADFYMMDYAVAPFPPPADKGGFIIFSILVALLASFGLVLAYDVFDKSVRSQRQLAKITSSVVLEAIPTFYPVNGKRRIRVSHPLINVPCDPNFTQEMFDSLLIKIKLRMRESPDHSIVVSSFEDGVGKSTISANLAVAMAKRGYSTLLVDADLRRGTVKQIFGLADSGGLTALLSKHDPLTDGDCLRCISDTKIPNLHAVQCGKEPPNPGALLSSPRMEEFLRFCAKHVAVVVVDTPPLGIVSDAVVLEKLFAHYVIVVRSGKTNVSKLVNRINEFGPLPGKILGYVLNGASHDAVGTYQRYSRYYTRPGSHAAPRRRPAIRSPAVMVPLGLLVCLSITGAMIIPLSPKKSAMRTPPAVIDSIPDQSIDLSTQPSIEAQKPVSLAADRESGAVRSASALGATPALPRVAVSQKRDRTIAETRTSDADSTVMLLREIRSKFARRDLTGLGEVFSRPALDDGEYYVLKSRYLCDIGAWRKAMPLVEKALTTPARNLSREKLTKEYFICRAKCLGAAFKAEPTPARGAAAMESWYSVKYQFRESPQDSRYLYADSELRRISVEVNRR